MQFKNKSELVKRVQTSLGLVADGVDGQITWNKIIEVIASEKSTSETSPITDITSEQSTGKNILSVSDAAYKLIIDHEVGGGERYYNSALIRPCYPGGASGVTIGIGYDLGYNSESQYESDWKKLLPKNSYDRLFKCLGYRGNSAKLNIYSVKDIRIEWAHAIAVFNGSTLPRFIRETIKAFPGSDELHPDAFGALVSLVFNRGGSTVGTNREEMKNIKNLISSKNYIAIANEVNAMKRIWINKGLDGLLQRRTDEAALIRKCHLQ